MSRSNIDNASCDLPPSYEEVCAAAEGRVALSSRGAVGSYTNAKSNETTPVLVAAPTAPARDILENTVHVPDHNSRTENTSISINEIVDESEFDAMSPATRIQRYQRVPQGPERQINNNNGQRWHQRLRRNLSYNGSIDDHEQFVKSTVYIVAGFVAVFILIAIISRSTTTHSNYSQSEEHLKFQKELDHLFEVNDYVSGRKDARDLFTKYGN